MSIDNVFMASIFVKNKSSTKSKKLLLKPDSNIIKKDSLINLYQVFE